MDIPSPNSLLDAEGNVDSRFGGTLFEYSTAETQAADFLCALGIVNVRQADDSASSTMELYLPEHTAVSNALQMEEHEDQAMIPAPEPTGSEASRTKADQATVAPAVSEPSLAEAAIILTSEQEPESIEDIQQTTEELVQLPKSPRRFISAAEPEGDENVVETVIQVIMLGVGPRADSTPIGVDKSIDSFDDVIASADSTECRVEAGMASTIPYTASHYREASRGRQSVTQESSDQPISIYEADEPAEFIIVDDNSGQAIVIDSSDDEIGLDDDDSGQSPRRRAQRKRSTPQSPEMVNWASKEYKTRSAASLTAAWENMWEQWEQIRAKPGRRLAQTLYRIHEKMFKTWGYELWNKNYRKHDGRRLCHLWEKHGVERKAMRQLTRKRDSELVRKLGRALRRLQEAEEEHLSISVAMKDGEGEDCDYVPTKARRLRSTSLLH
ncbi:unnamed protein product [Periconia digitata]|uniref:Uncharacterized protein n=1 Tax=Periconia digitata TaxID=1303443 RepID=A0A9W4UXQ5_9PLEO|nr:unnamed protein product [Periconia digitata]